MVGSRAVQETPLAGLLTTFSEFQGWELSSVFSQDFQKIASPS
jgi:hypothetical protein